MKFDMSGGAAVSSNGAIARLGLPVRLVSVIGATENLPSGHALKPGYILRAKTARRSRVHQHRRRGPARVADCLDPRDRPGARPAVSTSPRSPARSSPTSAPRHAGLFAPTTVVRRGRGRQAAAPRARWRCLSTPSTPISSRVVTQTSRTRRGPQDRARSPPPSSSSASPGNRRGIHSTPGMAWTTASRRPKVAPASACGLLIRARPRERRRP